MPNVQCHRFHRGQRLYATLANIGDGFAIFLEKAPGYL